MATQKGASRREWRTQGANGTIEEINSSSLQRIADACELMAQNYAELIGERNRYKLLYERAHCAA